MTTRKRVRHKPDNSGGGGAPGGTIGNFVLGPDFGEGSGSDDNTFTVGMAAALDTISPAADLGIGAALALETVNLAADLGVGAALSADTVDLAALLGLGSALTASYKVIDMAPQEDTWFDEANGTDVNGADTELFARQANVFGNQARNAYVGWDLTSFSTGSATTGGTHQATFRVSRTSGITNANLNFEIYTNATQPFEEDTDDWDTDEPPPGTQIASGSFNSLGTSLVTQTYTFSDADMSSALGNWMYFRFTGENGLGNTTNFRVISKEHTTETEPQLDFEVTL